MFTFLDENFLLETTTAQLLFHQYAAASPILDYHCHINPREIAENRKFSNITQLWLGVDHYKWRFMRSCGIDERFITGDASDYEKFYAWSQCLGRAIGNPLFHWSHLELQRYFGYHGYLNQDTAAQVWALCNEKLQHDSMCVRSIIRQSNVAALCTTDDPADGLKWHEALAGDPTFQTQVIPAWRPDKAMNLDNDQYLNYLEKLSQASGITIRRFSELKEALQIRLSFFSEHGCKLSDHALDYVMYEPASESAIEEIFAKRLSGKPISPKELLQFKTACMLFLAEQYTSRNWVMQLHYGCKRNNNGPMFQKLGPDAGFDCINNYAPTAQLTDFLNALLCRNSLPKTILYSLNPADNAIIDSILGCFQDSSAVSKIQHGSAWWFNDHKSGIEQQLTSLACQGNLSGFIGMLTDSRSFISYPRHEYFRRILCNLFGTWVERGEFPNDIETLGQLVKDISYQNAVRYFNFPDVCIPRA